MTKLFGKLNGRAAIRLAALTGLGLAMSGCSFYDDTGYASDNYASYQCDPYYDYDAYYDCDNGYGFVNIGFGGGWYDNFYYPGYGLFLFDTYGQRYNMRNSHRAYWGQQRYRWYQGQRGNRHHAGRGRGGRQGYTNGAIAWPEQNGGRVVDGEGRPGRHGNANRDSRGEREHARRDSSDDGFRQAVMGRGAVPEVQARRGGGNRDGATRGSGRRGGAAAGQAGGARAAVPNRPVTSAPARGRPAAQSAPVSQSAPAARPEPAPRAQPAARPAPRRAEPRNNNTHPY